MKTQILSLCLVAFFVAAASPLSAQTFRKDYIVDAPIKYKASDPWDRGKIFRQQTGHAGFFYNCDNEQCKRDSPYVCYKSEHRGGRVSCLDQWRRQIAEAKWRLEAGGCGCTENYPGCDCEPNVCLACNTHSGLPSIDYSKLPPGTATLKSKQTTPQNTAPSNPTIEYYRSGENQDKTNPYFSAVPGSIKDQNLIYRRRIPEASLPQSSLAKHRLHPSILAGKSTASAASGKNQRNYRNKLVPVSEAIAAQKQKLKKLLPQAPSRAADSKSTKRFRLLR